MHADCGCDELAAEPPQALLQNGCTSRTWPLPLFQLPHALVLPACRPARHRTWRARASQWPAPSTPRPPPSLPCLTACCCCSGGAPCTLVPTVRCCSILAELWPRCPARRLRTALPCATPGLPARLPAFQAPPYVLRLTRRHGSPPPQLHPLRRPPPARLLCRHLPRAAAPCCSRGPSRLCRGCHHQSRHRPQAGLPVC